MNHGQKLSFDKATDDQLWNICQEDRHVPKELIEPIVIEAIERNLFDYLIIHVMKKIIRNLRDFLYEANMSKEELMQIGRMAVYETLRNYQEDRDNTFNTFAYINIKSKFLKVLERHNSQKREVYKNMQSLDKQKHDDNDEGEYYYLEDHSNNTEKKALFKVEWDRSLALLNDRERQIIQYLVKGYSLGEMTSFFNLKRKSVPSLHRSLHQAFKKINPTSPKIDLHEIGLVYRTKEVVG